MQSPKKGISVAEIKEYVGQQVTLRLAPGVLGGPAATGRLVGTTDAADGLVVFLEPEGSAPGTQVSYHYHYIVEISPALPTSSE